MRFCALQELISVCCHQFLVGSDYMLACFQQALCEIIRRLCAAHGFTDKLNFLVIENIFEIFGEFIFEHIARKITQIKHIFYFDGFTQLVFYDIGVFDKDFADAGADNAVSHNCCFHNSP